MQIWGNYFVTKDWGGQIFFSHGNTKSRGVTKLIPTKLSSKIHISQAKADDNGRNNYIEL